MKKFLIFLSISMLAVIIGFFIGKNFFNPKETKENVIAKNINNNVINKVKNVEKEKEIPTSISEEKISVNTQIIEETYYNKCNHKIETPIKDIKNYINMTKKELQKEFPTWGIKEFGIDKVVLYKEEDDFCNEHFLVKDEDGYITIYTIDNDNNVLELLDRTEIPTTYLAQVDKNNLTDGIIVYTKQNLNKLIEDFE